jgi:MoaA/NifB/PqqE/SkfB family radical SAM enzyme
MLEGVKILQMELTSVCNAECPMCARNVNGVGINPYISLKNLSLEWFQHNITRQQILNLEKIFFCGNVGDPASSTQLIEIIKYFKHANPDLDVGLHTNGGLKTVNWWEQLGHVLDGTYDYCVFSIDGLEDTNHIYRRKVIWNKLIENVESFIKTGASAHWDMLVFDHNKHQIGEAEDLARKMGFTWFRTKETDRWDIYPPTNSLSPAQQFEKINYDDVYPVCEIKRDNSVFLDYTGQYWPCCHMAEAYLNKVGRELHTDIRQYNNQELFVQYDKKLSEGSPFFICKRACGTNNGKRSQWKREVQLK